MTKKLLLILAAATVLCLKTAHAFELSQTDTNTSDDKYQFNNTVEELFAHVDAFLIGVKYAELFPSALNCSKNLEGSIEVWNKTTSKWRSQVETNSTNYTAPFVDKLFDTTYWVSYSIAPSTDNCFGSVLESVVTFQTQKKLFQGFGDFFAAFLQNILKQVQAVMQIQTKIQAANDSNDTVAVAYWYGRLANIGLIFEPVADDSYNFENNVAPTTRLRQFDLLQKRPLKQWEEDSDLPNIPTLPYQRSLFNNMLSGTKGFIYASFVNQSENFTICSGNASEVSVYAQVFKAQYGNLTNITNLTIALDALADIMAASYPLTYSCWYGGYEAYQTANDYAVTVTAPKNLLVNLLESMGQLYDTIYYMMEWVGQDLIDIQTEQGMAYYFYRSGAYVGILTSLVFREPLFAQASEEQTDEWVPVDETSQVGDDEESW